MSSELNHNPFEPIAQITLSEQEKDALRAQARGFALLHPTRATSMRVEAGRPRQWYGWFARHVIASFIVVVALGGTGVIWAADSAEPDSTLYGIRQRINDRVRVSAVREEDAQIERELHVLGRYIEEEEHLIARELTL